MLVFPSNPNSGDRFGQWQWDGEKWTRGGFALALEALADVAVSDPAQGEFLGWDATAEKWVNLPPPEVDLSAYATQQWVGDQIAAIPAASLAGLADVSVNSPVWGQLLTYNGGTQRWENASTVAGLVINGAADSTALTVSAAAGQWGIVIGRSEPGTFVYGGDNSNGQQFVIEDIAGFIRFDARNARMILAQQGKSCLVIDDSGGIQINPYSQTYGTGLWITGAGGNWAEVIDTNVGGHGFWVRAGSSGSDYCALFRNQANNVNFFSIMGDGSGSVGPNNSSYLSWNSAGQFRLNGNATFGSVSLAQNGYEISPMGVVRQWGLFQMASAGMYQVSFPIAFPNACLSVVATPFAPQNTSQVLTMHGYNTTGFGVYQTLSGSLLWQAVGY